ncbi:MAG: ComF family protein [Alistipes sp.]|nr:ComF family protein [Alistipes sp.]
MSILNNLLSSVGNLIAPRRCAVCGAAISKQGLPICTTCEVMAPLTNFHLETENPMLTQFWGLMPVEHASALLWYIQGSGWQRAIHDIKYRQAYGVARELGLWWSAFLEESPFYSDIDAIVPVPLHWQRRLSRTYNQSEYLAEGLSRGLGVQLLCRAVRRSRYNHSQTLHSTAERWGNVEGIFSVVRPEQLHGRHLLLVDDVFTTGATIISLGNAILAATQNVRLSVATLSVSKARFDKRR